MIYITKQLVHNGKTSSLYSAISWMGKFMIFSELGAGEEKLHTINRSSEQVNSAQTKWSWEILGRPGQARHWRSTQSTKTLPLSRKTRIFVENIRWSCTIINGRRRPQSPRGSRGSWWQWWSDDSGCGMDSRADGSAGHFPSFLHPTFSLVSIKDDKGSNQNYIHDDDGNDRGHDCALWAAYIIRGVLGVSCKYKRRSLSVSFNVLYFCKSDKSLVSLIFGFSNTPLLEVPLHLCTR